MITACMIVKDEERNLARCLRSLAPIVDRIVIIDTGSNDKTVKIAEGYTSFIDTMAWPGSFSQARNHALTHPFVPRDSWVFVVDADEELVNIPGDSMSLSRHIQVAEESGAQNIPGMIVSSLQGVDSFNAQVRLFKWGAAHYEGDIHNQFVPNGDAVSLYGIYYTLRHYGYSLEALERKFDQRMAMLRAWREREPANPMPLSYMAHLMAMRDREESERMAIESITLAEAVPSFRHYPHLFYGLLSSLASRKQWGALFIWSTKCVKADPAYPDGWFFLGLAMFRLRRWGNILNVLMQYFSTLDLVEGDPVRYYYMEVMTANRREQVHYMTLISSIEVGNEESAQNALYTLQKMRAEGGSTPLPTSF